VRPRTRGTNRRECIFRKFHPRIATSIKEKRELLVAELLTSKAEVGDIPLNTPTAATRHIDFPPITAEDVRKAVIEAGNTVSGTDEVLTAIL